MSAPALTTRAASPYLPTRLPQQQPTIARRPITLVRNENHALPLNPWQHVLVTGWGFSSTQTLTADIKAHGVDTQLVYTGGDPDQTTIDAAVAAAQTSDVVVVTIDNAWGDMGQQALVNALIATGKPVIAVALASPYDVAYFPRVSAFLGAYGYQGNSVTAVSDVLFAGH